jgi:hypothetical protein|tara:strand:- start:77 stop:793 length:717 start_codon:yes stop_codon:yes gene_type:complete
MNKDKLERFIRKYNLNGNVNSVRWKSGNGKVSTSFVTPDKTLLGTVIADKFDVGDAELGVYFTDQLQKLLGVVGENIESKTTDIEDRVVSLNISDGVVSVDFVLSDLSVIPEPPALKRIPDFTTQIKVDEKFIDTFVKGVNAISDVETFSLIQRNGNLSVVIGHSNTNTNRVTIPVEYSGSKVDDIISFSAPLFKEVFVANKECSSAILEVSTEGLSRISFKVDDYDSTYYIVSAILV